MNAVRGGRRTRGAEVGALLRRSAPLLLVATVIRASVVDVALDETRGACKVRGSFAVPVPGAVAWEVLTDYDGIGRFVRSVRSSRRETGPDGQLLLRQDAVGGVFVLRRRMQVLLAIEEDSTRRIGFRDVLGKDFRSYAGEWRIAADPAGTRVDYALEAEPRAVLARAFCRGAMRGTAEDLLTQVRAEMMRRAGTGNGPAGEDARGSLEGRE